MSMIKLTKLNELRISHLTRAVEEQDGDEIFIQFHTYGGRPTVSRSVQIMQPEVHGRLVSHDNEYQTWAFSKAGIVKGLQEHKKFRDNALKEMINAK